MNNIKRLKYVEEIRKNKGKFASKAFSLEGSEGSGKGTIADMVESVFKEAGVPIMMTREPGGVPIAEDIRNVIVSNDNTNMTSKVETLLFAAARNQHIEEKVLPAIERGEFIFFDRFVDSSYTYQGYARGLDLGDVISINKFAMNGFDVDLVIYLDLDPKIGLERIKVNNRDTNRLDKESIEFYNKIREGFLYLKEHVRKDKMIVVDAEPSPGIVLASVLDAMLGGV